VVVGVVSARSVYAIGLSSAGHTRVRTFSHPNSTRFAFLTQVARTHTYTHHTLVYRNQRWLQGVTITVDDSTLTIGTTGSPTSMDPSPTAAPFTSLAAPSLVKEAESAAPSPPMDSTETPMLDNGGTMETQPPMDIAMETESPMENAAMETESPMSDATVPPTLPPPVHEDWSNSTQTPSEVWDGTPSPMVSDFPSSSPTMSFTTNAPTDFLQELETMPTPSPPFILYNETMVPIDNDHVPVDSPASQASCQIDFDNGQHETLLVQTVINVPIYVPAPESKPTQLRNYVSIVCTLPDHGDLTLQSNGTIAYHPHTSFVGTDEFWILRCTRNGNGGSFSSSSATASSGSSGSGSFSSATSMSSSGSSSNGNSADCQVQRYSVTVVATAETMRTRDSSSDSSPRLRRRRFWTSTGTMALVFGLAVAVIVLACMLAFCCHRERTKSLVLQQATTATTTGGNSSDSTNPTDPSSSSPPPSPLAEATAAEAVTATATATAAVRHSVLWERFSGIGQRLFRPVVAEPGQHAPLPVFKDQTRHCPTASAEMMAVIPNRLRRARPEASLGEGRPEVPPFRATTPSSLTTPTTVGGNGMLRSDRSDPPSDKEFRSLTDKDDLASANHMPMVTAVAMSETEECTNEDEDNGDDEYMF
jgi:hypothetical protein